MSSPISREDVAHIASLARLSVTEEELDLFTGQLADILDHAADVESLDAHDVAPTHHPYPMTNVLRADVVRPSLDREEVLSQAPSTESGQFRVPPVLGEA
ncbi:MAG: Asp-tRNA(Asn)/Glu-tRNA(Gln) amidotransferase subunit GatC [Acidimicrobiales bacterium]